MEIASVTRLPSSASLPDLDTDRLRNAALRAVAHRVWVPIFLNAVSIPGRGMCRRMQVGNFAASQLQRTPSSLKSAQKASSCCGVGPGVTRDAPTPTPTPKGGWFSLSLSLSLSLCVTSSHQAGWLDIRLAGQFSSLVLSCMHACQQSQ